MLARKRKVQDEEPLVPHGLVSQALETSGETSSEVPSPETVVLDPSQPKPPKPAIPPRAARVSSARVLHWPNVRKQVSGVRIPNVLPRVVAFAKLIFARLKSARGSVKLPRPWTRMRGLAANATNQLNEELKSFRARAVPELREIYNSVELPAKKARLREIASNGVTKLIEVCRDWRTSGIAQYRAFQLPAKTTRLRDIASRGIKVKAAIEVCQAWRAGAVAQYRALKERSVLVTDAAVGHIAEKAPRDGFKLRVRLAGVPLKMRIAFARAKLQYQLGRNSVAKDSRAWSSIALGAMAALLVMGLFATARHFAQASLPSNRVGASSSQEATPASTTSTVSQPQEPAVSPAKARLTNAAARSDSTPTKPQPKRATARPKMRRNPDDDYVAKDTFVYYGKRASR